MTLTKIFDSKCFGGRQKTFKFKSGELLCDTQFSIFLPPNAEKRKVPVLYWLSDMSSNHETFVKEAGAQRYAAQQGICIVCPDTSPRNVNIPELEDDCEVGAGAGFYVDAIKFPWSRHFRMHTYVTHELINVINKYFPVIPHTQGISGFSMGGHGAIVSALKNPGLYKSVSALAPVVNPIKSPLSQKAYTAYFGDVNNGHWRDWDATELVSRYSHEPIEIFIDQGAEDYFYKKNMILPESFYVASRKNGRVRCLLKWRLGYNHDYFYVASAIAEHIEYHANILKNTA